MSLAQPNSTASCSLSAKYRFLIRLLKNIKQMSLSLEGVGEGHWNLLYTYCVSVVCSLLLLLQMK